MKRVQIFVALALTFLVGRMQALDLQILAGPGVEHAAGSRSRLGATVRVVDDMGLPVEGSRVVFRLPSVGPTGKFLNGKREELVITDAFGLAEGGVVAWSRSTGPVTPTFEAIAGTARSAGLLTQRVVSQGKARSKTTQAGNSYTKTFVTALISAGTVAAVSILVKSLGNQSAPSTQIGSPSVTVKQ